MRPASPDPVCVAASIRLPVASLKTNGLTRRCTARSHHITRIRRQSQHLQEVALIIGQLLATGNVRSDPLDGRNRFYVRHNVR